MEFHRARKLGQARLRVIVALLVVAGSALVTAPANAATVLVDNSDPTEDGGGCGTAANRCNTIQAGVDAATPGDAVSVAAGTFDEGVVVDKPVRLEGAQAGVDARGRTGAAETVVRAPGGFEIGYGFDVRVPDVVIDGFSIHAAKWHVAIWLRPEAAGTEVANSLFTYEGGGAGVVLQGADDVWIHGTEFAAGGGWGVHAFDSAVARATIDRNSFNTGAGGGVEFMWSADASDLQILDNTSTDTFRIDRAVRLTLAGNEVSARNGAGTLLPAFELRNTTDVLISDNLLVDNFIGVAFFESGDGPPPQDAYVVGNTVVSNVVGVAIYGFTPAYAGIMEIHLNRIAGNDEPLWNDSETARGYPPPEFGAEDNWWGCNAGLETPECGFVTGTGDAYTEPHLVTRLLAPLAVAPGAIGTLTADLTHTSDGQSVDADLLPPVPVDFAVSDGSVSPTEAILESGLATATLTAPAFDADLGATAAIDSQIETARITVGSGAMTGTTPRPPATGAVSSPTRSGTSATTVDMRRPYLLIRPKAKGLIASRWVALAVRCAQAREPCTGRLELRLAGRDFLLGRARLQIAPNSERVVRVRLRRTARTMLSRKRRVRVVAQTKRVTSGPNAMSARVSFTLKR